jgi:hypothetical protein
LGLLACAPAAAPAPPEPAPARGAPAASATPKSRIDPKPPAAPAQLDPDGNDEREESAVTLPSPARFEKVGRHWAALQRICDFAERDHALYMTHATRPLGLGGATITRFEPERKTPFSLVFDWNRPGEPETGGAAGQGFLRIRDLGERFYVPDADPPYLGLGLGFGVEGYVFQSDKNGRFEPARRPGHLPPKSAILLPGAIHVFDAIRFRGKLYASAGALVPPKATASSSPGTLFVQGATPGRWDVAYTYAGAPGEAAVRLGFMTRFKDRLYVAVSPLYDLDRSDYVVVAPPADATSIAQEHARAVQVTSSGGAHTLRWYADRGKLYWITIGRDGGELRVTEDGERWTRLALPEGAGRPTDVLRAGERLVVMAERALLELSPQGFRELVRIEDKKSPFAIDDAYCAAPLAVFDGKLYAGDQKQGALWELRPARTP